MHADFPYTRLPGSLPGLVRKSSLWEGVDHILLVRGTRFTEEYRRFYYRDIEVIITQRCVRFGSVGWLLLNIVAFGVAMAVTAAARPLTQRVTGAIAALIALTLAVRLFVAIRFSCRCFIQTAVSREELPSVQRRWTADKVLARVRARIAEAQGEFPGDIEAMQAAAASQAVPDESAVPGLTDSKQRNPVRAVNLALAAFALLLVDAVQTFWLVQGPTAAMASSRMRGFSAVLVVSMGIPTILSLMSTSGVRHLASLRKLLIAALVFQGLDITLSQLLSNLYSLRKGVVQISLTGLRVWQWTISIDGSVCVLLGCGGLVFILANWETLRRRDLSPL